MNLKQLANVVSSKNQVTDILGVPLNVGDIVLFCKNKGTESSGLKQGLITQIYENNSVKLNTCKVLVYGKNCIKANTLLELNGINTKALINIHKSAKVKNTSIYLFYCVLNNNEDGICLFKPEYSGIDGFEAAVNEFKAKYNNEISIFPVKISFTIEQMLTVNTYTNKSLNFNMSDIVKLHKSEINTIKFPFEYNTVIPFNVDYVNNNNIFIDFCNTNFDSVFLNIMYVKTFFSMILTFWNEFIPYVFSLPLNSTGIIYTYNGIITDDRIKSFDKYKNIRI